MEGKKRLGWMDTLRGLLISSVVVGHATGKYNPYIYRFHMAAFFFVSCYMTKQERRGVVKPLYHRFMTVYLPVATMVVLMLLGAISREQAACSWLEECISLCEQRMEQ